MELGPHENAARPGGQNNRRGFKGRAVLMATIVAVASSAFGGVASPMHASAANATCDNPPANHQAAFWARTASVSLQNAVEGINTYQYLTAPNYCTTDTNSATNWSSAWAMAQSNSVNGGYSQVGIIARYGDSCVRYWAEDSETGYPYHDTFGACAPMGERHQVWVQFFYDTGSSCWKYKMNIDSSTIRTNLFCPLTYWYTPIQVDMAGETSHDASDIPGYSYSKTDWQGVQVQNWHDNNFYGACDSTYGIGFNRNTPANRYSSYQVSCNEFQAWTT